MTNLLMNRLNSFATVEGRRCQRISALQIRGVIREMEGGNPLPPQRPGEELRIILHHSWRQQASTKDLLIEVPIKRNSVLGGRNWHNRHFKRTAYRDSESGNVPIPGSADV